MDDRNTQTRRGVVKVDSTVESIQRTVFAQIEKETEKRNKETESKIMQLEKRIQALEELLSNFKDEDKPSKQRVNK